MKHRFLNFIGALIAVAGAQAGELHKNVTLSGTTTVASGGSLVIGAGATLDLGTATLTLPASIVVTSGSYANPAWITGLAWSKITSTPTTLSGYGIADPVAIGHTVSGAGGGQVLFIDNDGHLAGNDGFQLSSTSPSILRVDYIIADGSGLSNLQGLPNQSVDVGASPILDGFGISGLESAYLVGDLPAISGAALTNLTAANISSPYDLFGQDLSEGGTVSFSSVQVGGVDCTGVSTSYSFSTAGGSFNGDGSGLYNLNFYSPNQSVDSGAAPTFYGWNISSLQSSYLVGDLPAVGGAALTNLTAANLVGALPAIDGGNLYNVPNRFDQELGTGNNVNFGSVTVGSGTFHGSGADLTNISADAITPGTLVSVTAITPAANNNSTALATTEYVDRAISGASAALDGGQFLTSASGQADFTVTMAVSVSGVGYRVFVTPTSGPAGVPFYISAKTNSTFTVTFPSAPSGSVGFDWIVYP